MRGNESKETSRQRAIGHAAANAVRTAIRAGAESYDRTRDLPRLARIDVSACQSDDPVAAVGIVARLQSALRAERNRVRAGHWTYDLNRHIALAQAFRAESSRLAALRESEK